MRKLGWTMLAWSLAACGGGPEQDPTPTAMAEEDPPDYPDFRPMIWGGRTDSGSFEGELDPILLGEDLISKCYAEVEAGFPVLCPNSGNLDVGGCNGHQCMAQIHMCAAHKYMEIAEAVNLVELSLTRLPKVSGVIQASSTGVAVSYSIPPQSTSNRTAAYELATQSFAASGERGASAVTTSGCMASISGSITYPVAQNRPKIHATTYAEAIAGLIESTRALSENQLRAAGMQRQQTRDYAEASSLLFNGTYNSVRSTIAHLVNSDPDPAPNITVSQCSAHVSSDAVKAAVSLERTMALADTLASTSDEAHLTNLRVALGAAFPDLDYSGMTNDEFLDSFDLTRADVIQAREYLKQEFTSFSRTSLETSPGSGQIAGLASPPRPLPPTVALAKSAGIRVLPSSDPTSPNYRASGLIPMLDYLRWGARKALNSALVHTSLRPVMQEAAAMAEAESGFFRIVARSSVTQPNTVRIDIFGATSADHFVVVRGVDGVRCLVDGSIEGAPCTPANYVATATPESQSSTIFDSTHQLTGYQTFKIDYPTTNNPSGELYVLRHNSPNMPYFGVDSLGILGTSLYHEVTAGAGLHLDLNRYAEQDPLACGNPLLSCAGLPNNPVVPLESELTEDADPYENSWKHYLDLAEQMASEADALGEELIGQGLMMDLRSEAAMDELESTCGPAQHVRGPFEGGVLDDSLQRCLELPRQNWSTLGEQAFCIEVVNGTPNPDHTEAPDGQTCLTPGYEYVRGLGLLPAPAPTTAADCTQLHALHDGEGTAEERTRTVRDLLQGTIRWLDYSQISELMEDATYDEDWPYRLHVAVDGDDIIRLGDDSRVPCESPAPLHEDQTTALRGVAPAIFNELCSPTNLQRQDYIRAARRAFGTLGLLTMQLDGNMRRSWIAPTSEDSECNPVDGNGTQQFCSGTLRDDVIQLEKRCGPTSCRCLTTAPQGEDPSYGNVACNVGAKFDYVVDLAPSEFALLDAPRELDIATLWAAPGLTQPNCRVEGQRQNTDAPTLATVLCNTASNDLLGYDWTELYDLRDPTPVAGHWLWSLSERGLPFIGEPDNPQAPSFEEASELADAATVTLNDVYDALALACFMRMTIQNDCPSDPPVVSSPDDLRDVEDYLRCAGDAARQSASTFLLANLPVEVVEAIQDHEPGSWYPEFHGAQLGALSDVHDAVLDIAEIGRRVDGEIRNAQFATQSARLSLAENGVNQQIAELQALSDAVSMGVSYYLLGASGEDGRDLASYPGIIGQARAQLAGLQAGHILTGYAQQVGDILDHFEAIGDDLQVAVNRLNVALGTLDDLEASAQDAMARAAFLDESTTGEVFAVNTVMRRRYHTTRIRYQRAVDRARKMAWVAKRAMEQRFGVDLDDMNHDMTLVEAPATWSRDVCSFEGIDYEAIRESGGIVPVLPEEPGGAREVEVPDNFVEGYLGDYVAKLRLFAESYPFDFPFQDGSDLAVISLRDDIHRTTSECDVSVLNLLAASDSLVGAIGDGEEPESPWRVEGCADLAPDGLPKPCLVVEQRDGLLGDGRQANRVADTPVFQTAITGVLVQDVEIDRAATLLLTWNDAFVPADGETVEQLGTADPKAFRVTLELLGTTESVTMSRTPVVLDLPNVPAEPGFLKLDTSEGGTIRVTISPSSLSGVKGDVWFSELQLEALDPERAALAQPPPSDYVATTSSGMATMQTCPDLGGAGLRALFAVRCERLCAAGFAEECDDPAAPEQCFFEDSFTIGLPEIERGELIPSGAIAVGNFNYRHDLVGVNLVGTNVRDCSESDQPATCHANAFIPISLVHDGVLPIRNHAGEELTFRFGEGLIEHGKALASEAVLTNPLTADMDGLLAPYYKEELRGRPLTGTYHLRLWQEPALNWLNVEDVQLVFRYRYWTRFGH